MKIFLEHLVLNTQNFLGKHPLPQIEKRQEKNPLQLIFLNILIVWKKKSI